jgi:hypothetical protein
MRSFEHVHTRSLIAACTCVKLCDSVTTWCLFLHLAACEDGRDVIVRRSALFFQEHNNKVKKCIFCFGHTPRRKSFRKNLKGQRLTDDISTLQKYGSQKKPAHQATDCHAHTGREVCSRSQLVYCAKRRMRAVERAPLLPGR